MNAKDLAPTEYTMGLVKANLLAFLLSIPILFGYSFFYMGLHGTNDMAIDFDNFVTIFPFFLISIVAGVVIHELIHAVSWWWLDDISWNSIRFGFKWTMLTPYVHCPEPIEITNYRWAVAMPGIVLGLVPFILALIFQNGWLFGYGLIFTLAAGVDIIMFWMLRKVPSGSLVQDHPNRMGCKVFTGNKEDINT